MVKNKGFKSEEFASYLSMDSKYEQAKTALHYVKANIIRTLSAGVPKAELIKLVTDFINQQP